LNSDTSPNTAANEPISTTPSQAQPPANDQPAPHSSKKSRKRLLIGLIVAAIILIGGAITAFLIISNITNQAKDAAMSYTKAVDTHITAILNSSVKDRPVTYAERPVLADVAQGETFSTEYKAAVDLNARYTKFLDDTKQIVIERYATVGLRDYLAGITTAFNSQMNLQAPNVTDEASLKVARQAAKNMESRAYNFETLAKEYESYTYADKYREYQTNAVKALKSMAASWSSLAKQTTALNDLHVKIFAAQKSGSQSEAISLASEVATTSLAALTEAGKVSQSYKTDSATLNLNNRRIVEAMTADNYINSVAEKSAALKPQLEDFQKSLK